MRDVVRIRTNQKFTDHYTLYEEIGEGKFGKVFRCVEKDTNLELAAKSIRLKKDADLAKVEKEVSFFVFWRLGIVFVDLTNVEISDQHYDTNATSLYSPDL